MMSNFKKMSDKKLAKINGGSIIGRTIGHIIYWSARGFEASDAATQTNKILRHKH